MRAVIPGRRPALGTVVRIVAVAAAADEHSGLACALDRRHHLAPRICRLELHTMTESPLERCLQTVEHRKAISFDGCGAGGREAQERHALRYVCQCIGSDSVDGIIRA